MLSIGREGAYYHHHHHHHHPRVSSRCKSWNKTSGPLTKLQGLLWLKPVIQFGMKMNTTSQCGCKLYISFKYHSWQLILTYRVEQPADCAVASAAKNTKPWQLTKELKSTQCSSVSRIHIRNTRNSSWDETANVNFFLRQHRARTTKYKTYCPTKRKFTKIFIMVESDVQLNLKIIMNK